MTTCSVKAPQCIVLSHPTTLFYLYPSWETMGWQRRGVGVGEMRGSQLHNSHRTSSATATSHNSIATTTLVHLSRVDIEDSTPLQSPISVFNVRMWMHLVVILWWPHSLYYHLTMFNSFQLYFAFSGNSFLSRPQFKTILLLFVIPFINDGVKNFQYFVQNVSM